MLLGAHRPSVSVVTILQKAGTIRYTPGQMTVLDRVGLEAAVCECYGVVRGQFDSLLGTPVG